MRMRGVFGSREGFRIDANDVSNITRRVLQTDVVYHGDHVQRS